MTGWRAAIRILNIDFEGKSARFDVSPVAARDAERLARVARACQARGLTPTFETNEVATEGTPMWSCRDVGHDRRGLEYSFRVLGRVVMLERVTTALILIGESCDMEEITRKHLRFCVYELCANTVDHGRPCISEPEVHITVRTEQTAVQVIYRDNGRMFPTDRHGRVDMERKILRGEKRGLGLFLLHNLAHMEYSRDGDWNSTILKLDSRISSGTERKRRAEMNGITVEIIPCHVKDAAVIKPIGSVDASTAQTIETQIQALIGGGTRRLVIDCSGVEFVSSSGIGIFLGAAGQLRDVGGDLLFMNLPPHVEELFDIINLKAFFTVIKSLDALQAPAER